MTNVNNLPVGEIMEIDFLLGDMTSCNEVIDHILTRNGYNVCDLHWYAYPTLNIIAEIHDEFFACSTQSDYVGYNLIVKDGGRVPVGYNLTKTGDCLSDASLYMIEYIY